MRVPGEGIKGKEYADHGANVGDTEPIHLLDYCIEKGVKKFINSHLKS